MQSDRKGNEMRMEKRRRLIVVSGFSGAGKGTLLKEIIANNPEFEVVISCTTRSKRNETDLYYFISKEQFEELKNQNGFLEINEYSGEFYGTPRKEIKRILGEGKCPVVEIDPTGFEQIKASGYFAPEEIYSVFIEVDAYTLLERLHKRGTEDPKRLEQRLHTAMKESDKVELYDVVIENDVFTEALVKLEAFMKGEEIASAVFDKELFQQEMKNILEDEFCCLDEEEEKQEMESLFERMIVLLEDAMEEGRKDGEKAGKRNLLEELVIKKVQKGKSMEEIAEELELEWNEVLELYERLHLETPFT